MEIECVAHSNDAVTKQQWLYVLIIWSDGFARRRETDAFFWYYAVYCAICLANIFDDSKSFVRRHFHCSLFPLKWVFVQEECPARPYYYLRYLLSTAGQSNNISSMDVAVGFKAGTLPIHWRSPKKTAMALLFSLLFYNYDL
ncbi:hypothetical protein COOONC_09017 [Cooperia oncophora]